MVDWLYTWLVGGVHGWMHGWLAGCIRMWSVVYLGVHACVCVGVRALAWGPNPRLTQTTSHTRFFGIFHFYYFCVGEGVWG